MIIKSIADLQSLIDSSIEESTVLEYKSSFAKQKPTWREELAKDVSALANSNGGTIIYGIREKDGENGRSVPEKFTPISNKDMSKDQLSQLLSSNIQPIIEGLEITYIPYDESSGFYAVFVPKSTTAHQNRLSHIYYARRNATVEAMEDYAIRDVMNRCKTPNIDLDFTLEKIVVNVTKKDISPMSLMSGNGMSEEHYQRVDYKLKYCMHNKGEVYAQYINCFIYVPISILNDKSEYRIEDESAVIFEDNTTRDLMGINGIQRQYGPIRYDPLLPGTSGRSNTIALNLEFVDSIDDLPTIRYSIHADNAPVKEHILDWKKVHFITKTRNEVIDPFAPPRFP